MKFSLIVGTKGRRADLDRLLESIAAQDVEGIELIIVATDVDPGLSEVIGRHREDLEIVVLESNAGLSGARNIGLQKAAGEIIAFPDDDCWYPQGVLERVETLLSREPSVDGVTGRAITPSGEETHGTWMANPAVLDRSNVWAGLVSFTMFLRRDVVESVGEFDERLGVGSGTVWGSGEESDFLIRALDRGFHIRYDPGIEVVHPSTHPLQNDLDLIQSRRYAAGNGFVLRKHGFPRRKLWVRCAKSVAGILWSLLRLRWDGVRFYTSTLLGRLEGWYGYSE